MKKLKDCEDLAEYLEQPIILFIFSFIIVLILYYFDVLDLKDDPRFSH